MPSQVSLSETGRGRSHTHTHTHTHGIVKTEAEIGIMCPRNASNYQSWKRQGTYTPQNLQGSPALLTSWLQTFGLQNGERINFCCFKPQISGCLL